MVPDQMHVNMVHIKEVVVHLYIHPLWLMNYVVCFSLPARGL